MKIFPCRNRAGLLFCLLLLPAWFHTARAAPFKPGPFVNKNNDYQRLMGLTAGVGKIKTDGHEQGASLYVNAYLFWFNLSAEYQGYDNRTITNTYTGLGLGRYLQIQYGYGDEGYLIRARSEFEVVGKLTVFIARERYRNKPVFDNTSVGIGYNF